MDTIIGILIILIIIGGSTLYVRLTYVPSKTVTYRQFLKRFAFHDVPIKLDSDIFPATLLYNGRKPRISQFFAGKVADYPVTGLSYTYRYDNLLTSQHEDFTYTVLRIITPEERMVYPYALVNAIAYNEDVKMAAGGGIPHGQKLQLEGNFSDSYEVTILPNTAAQVLQMLTPDFMIELLDANLTTAIEFSDHQIYVIIRGTVDPGNSERLSQLEKTLQVIVHQLQDIAWSWQASSSKQEIDAVSLANQKLRVDKSRQMLPW